MNDRKLYTGLALAGALPFVACAVLIVAGVDTLPPFGSLDRLVNSYGLAIICFLAGTHWAMHLSCPEAAPFNLLIASNTVFLVAWFMYQLAETRISLATQVVALVFLLLVDRSLAGSAVVSRPYFRMRMLATSLAAVSLLAIALR